MGSNEELLLGAQMKNWKDSLKKKFDENPTEVIIAGALAVTAAAKLLDALSAAQGRRAYSKQVDHRVKSHK